MAKARTKLKRTSEIGKVLAHYGFEFLLESPAWWSYVVAPQKLFLKKKHEHHTAPERVRKALEDLGPTFIKLGQAASTRPDLVPEAYVQELSKLQDNTAPEPYGEISHVIKQELGLTPENAFAVFDCEPAGSASLAQAYPAVLPDGRQVMVKVQRPNIRQRVDGDLLLLRDIVSFVCDHTSYANNIDLRGWFDEFEFTLRNELDFTREGRNADRFRRNFEDDSSLYIAKIYWEFSTPRVLTMEKIDGIKITDLDALKKRGIDPGRLARTATLIVLKMVYDQGFFHADPHAGNFFVLDDGRIGLIDYGMVGRIDEELRESLMRIALAIARNDSDQLTDEILSFAYSEGRVNRENLKRDVSKIMITHTESGTEKLSMAKMLNETLATAARHSLMVPSTIALLARTFTMAEGMGAKLDPNFNLTEFAQPYLEEIFAKRYSQTAILERAKTEGPFLADFALRLPKRAERMISKMERGEFSVVSRIDDIDEIVRQFHTAANRVAMSMIVSALTVTLAILTLVYRPRGFRSVGDGLFTLLLVVVIGAGTLLLLSIWRSGRKD